jgi:putative restriction endonuclease
VIGRADEPLRSEVFWWLTALRDLHGDVLPRTVLEEGAPIRGDRVRVIGPQGIFKPRQFEVPLSITTSPRSPYGDRFDRRTGAILYSYRGTDPSHADNLGLRRAMRDRIPLVYFHGIAPGSYVATYPVFVVGDDPRALTFSVQADDLASVVELPPDVSAVAEDPEPRRAYVTASVRRRVHQLAFRERVIRAYQESCALCRLRHRSLLDAAHITPDSDPEGEPVVSNGLALCKLHHAAFDSFFFAVRPDYRVEVKQSILTERDGPMLIVGLQEIHEQRIQLPAVVAQRPDPDRLARRYELFREAS